MEDEVIAGVEMGRELERGGNMCGLD